MAKSTSKVKFDISGIPELKRNMDKLKDELFAVLPEAAQDGADIIKASAQEKARKKSGEMADGIISEITWDKKAPVAFAGVGMDPAKNDIFVKRSASGKRYYYPASIEYGHPGAPAYPFMRPAADENKSAVKKVIRDRVKKVIEGVKP